MSTSGVSILDGGANSDAEASEVRLDRLTAEELLAGADLEHEISVPVQLTQPGREGRTADGDATSAGNVRIRPLRLKDVQLIAGAAKSDEVLTSVLMIERALIEPKLKRSDISRMPTGLVKFLIDRINHVSGLSSSDAEIRELAGAPIVQTFFVLAREFGWTPDEIRRLTIGQVLGYLEMLDQSRTGVA